MLRETSFIFLLTVSAILVTACGSPLSLGTATTTPTASVVVGGSEPAVRFIFQQQNFTSLANYVTPINTAHACLGDVLKNYYVSGPDYSGAPIPFPFDTSADPLAPTTRPTFVKNVSVDITQTYFALTQSFNVQTDHCSQRGLASDPGPSSCADFDQTPPAAPAPTVIPIVTPTVSPAPSPTATPTTTQYYDTGYYRVRDDWCTSQGPIPSADPETTKAFVGGVNIDIDRTQLGAQEDLLMMVTYHALNSAAVWPGPQTANDATILQINLIGTAQGLDTLLGVPQPRSNTYYNPSPYPVYLKEIATLEDPYGSLRTEQIYLPISQNVLIDRVRIERVRGSYHLYEVDLYRLGNRQ